MKFLQLFLGNVLHESARAAWRSGEQSAAPVYDQCDARILSHRQCLNPAAGVAHYSDLRGIDLAVIWAVLAPVLSDGPVNRVDQLGRPRGWTCGCTLPPRARARSP